MKKIQDIVSWYQSKGRTTNDIATLQENYSLLSCYHFKLSEECGKSYKEFLTLEHDRKVLRFAAIDSSEGAMNQREVKAEIITQEIRLKEKQKEGEYTLRKLMLGSTDKILTAMQMQLAILRKELQ